MTTQNESGSQRRCVSTGDSSFGGRLIKYSRPIGIMIIATVARPALPSGQRDGDTRCKLKVGLLSGRHVVPQRKNRKALQNGVQKVRFWFRPPNSAGSSWIGCVPSVSRHVGK